MDVKRKSILLLLFLGFVFKGVAQNTDTKTVNTSFSLEEAVKFAIENGYDVKSKSIDLEVAKKKIWETTAMGLPQISGTVAYQHIFNVPEFGFPVAGLTATKFPDMPNLKQNETSPGSGIWIYSLETPKEPMASPDNATWDLTVSQLIFSGEYIVGLRAAKVFREMSEQNLTKSYADIKETVSSSYYLALVLDENVRNLKETQKVTDANLKDLTAMGDQGLVEETGVDQVRLIKSNIDNAVSSLERAAKVSKNLLKFQMGLPIEGEIVLTEGIDKYNNESIFSSYLGDSFDVTKTIDYQVLETGVKLQKLSWDREKTTFLPSVAGFYRHYQQFKEPLLNFQPKDVAGINVTVPIFSSGMRRAKVQQARLNFEKMKVTQQQAVEGLNLQYQNTFNDFQTAYASFVTNKKNMELAKKIFDQTMIKYKEGVGSTMDLNTSQNQYLTTQRDYFTALNNLLSAKVKLDKLLSKN